MTFIAISPISALAPSGSFKFVPLSAITSDVDGTVTQVDFYANGSIIGSQVTSPYTLTWATGTPGTYVFTADATDNDGAKSRRYPDRCR